jgi:NADPH-dependent 2,4-dienoyl-CoA reductase/sulfur reductase-like enzyme
LDPGDHRLRDFLTRAAQPYEFYEPDSPEALDLLARHRIVEPRLPVVVDGERVFDAATVRTLVEAWGGNRPPSRAHYDLAIVGAGPAGLARGSQRSRRCVDDNVVVVGAGNSAGQAVLSFADAGARVTMCVRGEALGRTMSAYLITRIEQHPRIEVRLRTQVRELHADDEHLRAVTVENAAGSPGRSSAIRSPWKPACPACSQRATSATARPSGSPEPSVKAAWL